MIWVREKLFTRNTRGLRPPSPGGTRGDRRLSYGPQPNKDRKQTRNHPSTATLSMSLGNLKKRSPENGGTLEDAGHSLEEAG